MRKLQAVVVSLAVVTALPSCGGGGGGTTTPTQTGPSQASIVVSQTAQGQVCFSPLANFNFRVAVPIRIAESAGLGANFNFIRLSLMLGGVEVERQEIGANLITAGLGSNRLAANGTITAPLRLDFNNSNVDSFNLLFNFTDDRGNVLQANLNNLNVTAILACTI